MTEQDPKKVVFVCTGNVFRSLTAEFSSRAAHEQDAKPSLKLAFESAGTRGRAAKMVRDDVKAQATALGLDVSMHQSRLLTQEIMDSADLIIAMDRTHQSFIKDNFGYDAPLYLEIAEGISEEMHDVYDYSAESEAFIHDAMNRINANREQFLANLPKFIK